MEVTILKGTPAEINEYMKLSGNSLTKLEGTTQPVICNKHQLKPHALYLSFLEHTHRLVTAGIGPIRTHGNPKSIYDTIVAIGDALSAYDRDDDDWARIMIDLSQLAGDTYDVPMNGPCPPTNIYNALTHSFAIHGQECPKWPLLIESHSRR